MKTARHGAGRLSFREGDQPPEGAGAVVPPPEGAGWVVPPEGAGAAGCVVVPPPDGAGAAGCVVVPPEVPPEGAGAAGVAGLGAVVLAAGGSAGAGGRDLGPKT